MIAEGGDFYLTMARRACTCQFRSWVVAANHHLEGSRDASVEVGPEEVVDAAVDEGRGGRGVGEMRHIDGCRNGNGDVRVCIRRWCKELDGHPVQHPMNDLNQRIERQRREEDQKTRTSKKAHEATSPQTVSEQEGGNLKSMKEKSNQTDKDAKEGSSMQVVGPGGEITAGFLLKKSAKMNGWSRRWFVLNEKRENLGTPRSKRKDIFAVSLLWR